MNLILLGAPGAGKGTQAERLEKSLHYTHISTGDVLRKEIASGSEAGKKIAAIIDNGDLISDEWMLSILKQVVSTAKGDIIFDGFPRTVVQAEMLDNMLAQLGRKLGKVINITLADEVVVSRLSARKQCKLPNGETKQIGPNFSLEDCKAQGGEVFTRKDDTPQSIAHRLSVYHKQTAPVVDFYRNEGRFVEVNGDQTRSAVFDEMIEKLYAKSMEE